MQNYERVRVGSEAVDRDGDTIGTVDELGTDYFVVRQGLIFPKNVYIPLSAVDSIDAGGDLLRINVDKSALDNMGWDAPPTEARTDASSETARVDDPTATSADGAEVRTSETRDAIEAAEGTLRVPVHEEDLRAETVRRQAGAVEVRKSVVEEEQTLDVPVTQEQVEVRRYAVDRPAAGAEIVDTGDTIRVPVMGERVNVEKDVRVAEELEINKRAVTERQRVTDTIRREEVEVEREGDVGVLDETGTTQQSRSR